MKGNPSAKGILLPPVLLRLAAVLMDIARNEAEAPNTGKAVGPLGHPAPTLDKLLSRHYDGADGVHQGEGESG